MSQKNEGIHLTKKQLSRKRTLHKYDYTEFNCAKPCYCNDFAASQLQLISGHLLSISHAESPVKR